MKSTLTEVVFILDRSGSMGGLEKDTIGGYNEMLHKQKELGGEVLLSTVLFDHQFVVIHNRLPIQEVPDLTRDDYYVRGSTALLDAVGRSIDHIKSVQRMEQRIGDWRKPANTLFVITTDGLENASTEYTYEKIKHMISRQQEFDHWEFIFLGANIDAINTAKRFGIHQDHATNFHADSEGVKKHYKAVSDAISDLRINACIAPKWKDEIEKDFEDRKKE